MDQSDFTLLTLVQSCSLETSPEGDSGICCFSSSVFPGLSLLPTHRPARLEHWSASVVNLTVTSHFSLVTFSQGAADDGGKRAFSNEL